MSYKGKCKKERSLLEQSLPERIVTFNNPSESISIPYYNDTSTVNDLTEVTGMSNGISPSLSLTGHSVKLTTSDMLKNPLVNHSHGNVHPKDTVIVLPFRFATSTPKRLT